MACTTPTTDPATVPAAGPPVVWHCPDGGSYGHRVQAADLDRAAA